MSCNRIWIRCIDVKSPVIPDGSDFEDTLFQPEKYWIAERQLDLKTMLKPHLKITRRMNRTSSMAYLSASALMERSGLVEEDYDPYRFGTVFSTTNTSYESVLRILNTLYENGRECVSPIDFTYSVGNSLISGITMQYNLKGPSTMLPLSEGLQLAKIILEENDADCVLAGTYNICLSENLDYYKQFSYLNGEEETFTGILENASGMVIREQAVSMILENDSMHPEAQGCCLSGMAIKRKTKISKEKAGEFPKDSAYEMHSIAELSEFQSRDFEETMALALQDANISAEEVEVVFSCASGHPGMDFAEYEALEKIIPNAIAVTVNGIFGANFGGNFMLNCAAAVTSLKKQKLPPSMGVKNSKGKFTVRTESRKINTILVNGYNELGNIISGVIQWI
jgi:3-oxoacyl-[acyl-carrier-protein] synthase II